MTFGAAAFSPPELEEGEEEKIKMDSRLRGNDGKSAELDYTRLLSRALRAMTSSAVENRCANVCFVI